ncbi:unnamed protein product [Kuraishia capsulata CBS 1993]|uniref:Large ribosomal subunit protein uL6 alpha-beta domain-containing protein n=1 Tax=Kuraishia capsulata CBS 1993 TaxID=1382522 RepID=W6MT77_9ASCO|nr:uncharacterized protein KUCA_T00005581001 [Kuraishia capsulata CBS 1993]CDK29588.1 unnamed protein product [Kuraishia capsulata CBS 1993]
MLSRNIVLQQRLFSTARPVLSHIGSAPIRVPEDFKIEMNDLLHPKVIRKGRNQIVLSQLLTFNGPKGSMDLVAPNFIQVEQQDGKMNISIPNAKDKIQRSLWGTFRTLIDNNIKGVTEGHVSMLKLRGTGYRAMLETKPDGKKWVMLKIGKADLQGLPIPEGIEVSIPTQTSVILEGTNLQQVNLYAARLRKFHPPEPYKGKGIYMNDETIKLKDRKVK